MVKFDSSRPCGSRTRDPDRYTRSELEEIAEKMGVETKGKNMDFICKELNKLSKKPKKIKKEKKKKLKEIEWVKKDDPDFSEFIDNNFSQFTLTKPASDSVKIDICKCNVCKKGIKKCICEKKFKPFLYQKFVRRYLRPDSPNKGLLLFHGLGSGKTCSAILAAELNRKQLNRDIVVLLPASLRNNFKKEIGICGNADFIKKYKLVAYNANNVLEKMPDMDNKFIIIDEVHNLISMIMSEDSKLGVKIMERIVFADNTKIVMLSGTPIVNNPFEMAILFNFLQLDSFVMDSEIFDAEFVNKATNTINNSNRFKNKIRGMVSYFKGESDESDFFPGKDQIIVQVEMSDYQYELYKMVRILEIADEDESTKKKKNRRINSLLGRQRFSEAELKSTIGKGSGGRFKVKSRQFSTFVFPPGKTIERNPSKLTSKDLDDLDILSPKFAVILEKIQESDGPVFVYSNFKTTSGIDIFAKVLKKNRIPFRKWVGGQTDSERSTILSNFNDDSNIDGSKIKALLSTSAGAEGITLLNVRQVHIMEPHWNETRLKQVIGRTRRICSHHLLPKDEQVVKVFVYVAVYNGTEPIEPTTTDEVLLNISEKKQVIIEQFEQALKESAVDCRMNFNQNDLDSINQCLT